MPWRYGLAALTLQQELARCTQLGFALTVPSDAPLHALMAVLLLK